MLAAVIGLPAHATPTPTPISTTINLGTVFTGNTPDGGPNWLTATFASTTGSSTGTLTLTANLGGSDFVKGQNGPNIIVAGWSFFLTTALASTNPYSCTPSATNICAAGVSTQNYTAPPMGLGTFNLTFGWPQNTFEGTDSAVYTLNFANTLNSSPFGLNADNWSSVAHVQGITGINGTTCSGWIVSGSGSGARGSGPCISTTPPQPVPEPAELGMFGFGVLLIGMFLGLRRRWQ